MTLIATAGDSKEFELAPAGNHIARCYSVLDLGYHDKEWQGVHSSKRIVRIAWELPNELMEDGRPFSVSSTYTLSSGEKANLRRDLQSWRGKPFTVEELEGFDIETVIGVPAMVNVVHNPSRDGSKIFANVASVTPLPSGFNCPAQINETLRFSVDDHAPGEYEALPEWAQKKINLHTQPVGVPGNPSGGAYDLPPTQYDERNPPPADYEDLEELPF